MVSQSCQQHIPAGGAGVVVGAHSSSQCATQVAKIVGLVGHPLMHADSDPPGQPLGDGLGAGAGASVVVAGQSCLHTETQASYAAPVTTAHAASQALREPPGQSPEGAGGLGLGGLGDGGVGVGAGVGGTFGFVVSMSPTFKFKKEYEESG